MRFNCLFLLFWAIQAMSGSVRCRLCFYINSWGYPLSPHYSSKRQRESARDQDRGKRQSSSVQRRQTFLWNRIFTFARFSVPETLPTSPYIFFITTTMCCNGFYFRPIFESEERRIVSRSSLSLDAPATQGSQGACLWRLLLKLIIDSRSGTLYFFS